MDQTVQLVTFRIGNEEFAVDIRKVQEINKTIKITKIPNAPSYVEGVVNLRGKIIPIVSLRRKLGLDQAAYDKTTRIMVADVQGQVLGFVVDSVSEVLRIHDPKIEPAPGITNGSNSSYVEGVINLEDRILMLLDLEALFGNDAQGGKLAA